jgi:hypothetical protein
MNLGRSWHESWVCVVRVKSTEQDLRRVVRTSLAGGCYLGVCHVRCLWQVHVTGRGPGVECLHGMKPRDGRCCDGTGCQVFR